MADDNDEYSVSPISSETRQCAHCKQETTWNLYERTRWFGLRKSRYWACGRCGIREQLADGN